MATGGSAACGEAGGGGGCGCASPMMLVKTLGRMDRPWTDGTVTTPLGEVPRARTALAVGDRIGTVGVRCGLGRMNYRVPPGLYAVGQPTPDSPVLVSANYKFSFDRLRSELAGRDAWLLVLDTHGINVWCAAGKGLFGTDELVRRVFATGLARVVSHRKLVVPQLAATGVSAHVVRRTCGFTVVYGPVRAADLPAFLDARMKATPEMRRVRFGVKDRAALIPVEIVMGAKIALPVALAFLVLGGLGRDGYTWANSWSVGMPSAVALLTAFVGATVLGPLLLPWLPGRAFALKGALLGLALGALVIAFLASTPAAVLHLAAWALIVPTVASFLVMTFTGSSTYTSLSGVLREMRIAVPLQIAAGATGIALWVGGLFFRGGLQ